MGVCGARLPEGEPRQGKSSGELAANLVVRDIRRPSTFMGKADADWEEKSKCTNREPGVMSAACSERN